MRLPLDYSAGASMGSKAHWQHVYATKAPDEVSWFQPGPTVTAHLLAAAGLTPQT